MFRLAVLSVVVAAAFALRLELDGEWDLFKSAYEKQYRDTDEFIRRSIWENNLAFIEKHNMEADMGVHTYRVGVNQYADMTSQEFGKMMNGFNMPEFPTDSEVFGEIEELKAPTEVDWRNKGYVTGVKDQKQCGSCWAFSATGSLEGQHFKKTGTLTSLSEQNLVDCSRKEGNMGCGGGLMDQAFTYIRKNDGIDTEMSYPYLAKDAKCKFTRENVGATDTGFVDIQHGSETALMQAVATVGPISVAIDASHQSFQLYKSGIYTEEMCSPTRLDHGVLAIGYGSDSGQNYWLVKNSWGIRWGMEGFIKMAKDHNNMCGIATAASYPKV